MRKLTGVSGHLSAIHTDIITGVPHGHTWEIVAWFDATERLIDARELQARLDEVLATWDHKTLPDTIASGEALAAEILSRLPKCIEVEVRRPLERIYAKATA